MRDVVLPVGTAQAAGSGAGFEMLVNAELNPRKGFHGLRTVFNFKLGAGSQTVDQTVLTNDRRT